ncbi:MAG: hypothetical protein QOE29_2281 [Gaiellaceae bacterium]|jgi:uncharacterized membrane protein|nr:hypothetical protein [Gaiellaceae bacterium]
MATPERPPVDPRAVDQAYRAHRAKRRAKAQHARSKQLAGRRFAVLLVMLFLCSLFLIVTIWSAMQQLFGF